MSKEPEELKEDKGGKEGGELGRSGGRQHSPIPTPVQGSGASAWALRPERLGSQGLNLPLHMGLMGGVQTEIVSYVPFLWQARAPGL